MQAHNDEPKGTELDAAISRVSGAGLARWPGLSVDESVLCRHLSDAPEYWLTASLDLAADRYLAIACTARAPRAAELLREVYGGAIQAGARSVDASPAFVDDVMQQVFDLLLLGTSKAGPRLAQYQGRGPLAGWLRTTARRVALRSVTAAGVQSRMSEDVLATELADGCDQELALLRARYSELFRQALSEALRELPARDRMLLQLNIIGGVSTVRIGKMYKVNQSTISRQLRQAAHKTFDAVKQKLQLKLGIVSDDVESLLAIVRSHMEMTLSVFEEPLLGADTDH